MNVYIGTIVLFFAVLGGARANVRWQVEVTTCRRLMAGTDAHVFLTLYSGDKRSREVRLPHDGMFRGRVQSFYIVTKYLAGPDKIHVRRDDFKPNPGWSLCGMTVINTSTLTQYVFKTDLWVEESGVTLSRTAVVR